MSSGFVSGGTADQPLERDDEWRKAQQEIEDRRRLKEEESRHGGEKSLYEILQNNKVAKEEAFQESIKLKNQFRNLDEDEVEFLDSVLESTRAKEEAVKKETTEQLELFRQQQEKADRGLLNESKDTTDAAGNPTEQINDTQWAVSTRKRKRIMEEKGLKGPKLRKPSSTAEASQSTPAQSPLTTRLETKFENGKGKVSENGPIPYQVQAHIGELSTNDPGAPTERNHVTIPKSSRIPALCLADYSSEDD